MSNNQTYVDSKPEFEPVMIRDLSVARSGLGRCCLNMIEQMKEDNEEVVDDIRCLECDRVIEVNDGVLMLKVEETTKSNKEETQQKAIKVRDLSINYGGLMRCCIKTVNHMAQDDAEVTSNSKIECIYCGNVMKVIDRVIRWDRDSTREKEEEKVRTEKKETNQTSKTTRRRCEVCMEYIEGDRCTSCIPYTSIAVVSEGYTKAKLIEHYARLIQQDIEAIKQAVACGVMPYKLPVSTDGLCSQVLEYNVLQDLADQLCVDCVVTKAVLTGSERYYKSYERCKI